MNMRTDQDIAYDILEDFVGISPIDDAYGSWQQVADSFIYLTTTGVRIAIVGPAWRAPSGEQPDYYSFSLIISVPAVRQTVLRQTVGGIPCEGEDADVLRRTIQRALDEAETLRDIPVEAIPADPNTVPPYVAATFEDATHMAVWMNAQARIGYGSPNIIPMPKRSSIWVIMTLAASCAEVAPS